MLKLITPVRVLFNLDTSRIAAHPKMFIDFLGKVKNELNDAQSEFVKRIHPALEVEVILPKAKENDSSGTRDAGRFFLFPHLMVLRFRKSFLDEMEKIYTRAAAEADKVVEKYSEMLRPDLDSLFIKLNDNTVAIMSLDMHLNDDGAIKGNEGWNRLNQWADILIKGMLTELYPLMIFSFLKELNQFSNQTKDNFVYDVSEYKIFFVLVGDPQYPYPDLHKRFIPMKTIITLCIDRQSYNENRWTDNIIQNGVMIRIKETEIHINDDNNLVITEAKGSMQQLNFLWELIASACYYYVAMNVINVNLIRYIAITSDKHSDKGLLTISRDMENIINSVTILKLRYHDFEAEITGVERKIFHMLQDEWDFENIVANMQSKLEHCRNNIQILNTSMQRRNQGRIETVLTGVAGMAIVSVFVELAAYASQIPEERRKMIGDVPGFMDLGFILSGNTLSWIGIILALSVLIFTISHRSG